MAGRVITTTVSINGDIDASVQRAINSTAQRLDSLRQAAATASNATDRLTAIIDLQSEELEQAKRAYANYVLSGEDASDQAKETARRIQQLSGQLNDNQDALKDAQKAADKLAGDLDETGDKAKSAKEGFTIMRGAISTLIGNGLTLLISKCGEAIRSITGLSESTREYREDINKLQTAFETAGHTTEEATSVYKELFSVFGEEDRAVEAAQQIAKLAENEKEMATMTNIATGAWAMWGDSLATESLMEAINSTAKIGTVQGTLADALEWTGVNLDTFNKTLEGMTTEEERSAYILKTLNGLYDDAADKYRENSASIIEARLAQSEYTDTLAELGAITEPIMTKVQEGFTKILKRIVELVSNGDLTAFGESIEAAFDGFINDVLPKILDGLNGFINDVLPVIVNAIQWIGDNKEVILGIAAAIGVVSAALGVMNGVLAVQSAIAAANPVTWIVMAIVAAIGALIAIIVVCVKHWDKIREAASAAVDWIVDAWNGIAGWFNTNVIQPIAGFFSGLWNGITSGVSNAVSGIVDVFSTGFNSLVGIIKPPINAIIAIINGVIDSINSIGFEIPDWVPSIGGQGFSLNIPKVPMLATGGFTNGVSIAGEAGTEAVISFDPAYRAENISYWAKAGQMLGADVSDYVLYTSSGGSNIDLGGVTFAPRITITGSASKETVMKAIEDEYPEFLDMLEDYFMERGKLSYA